MVTFCCEFAKDLWSAVNLGGTTQHDDGNELGINPLTKNSSVSQTEWRGGLDCGLLLRNFWISFPAVLDILEGMTYWFVLILVYVSFKDVVSKGGRPIRRVYLINKEITNVTRWWSHR